jgi:O-antigen biosynthesis protein
LSTGGFEGRDPGPNFDSSWYLSSNDEVKKAGINPLVHYLKYGIKEGWSATSQLIGESSDRPSPAKYDDVIIRRFPNTAPLSGFRTPYFGRRLNLVTDSINSNSLFGGVATSIVLSTLLAEKWECDLRIITRTELAIKKNYYDIIELNGIPKPVNVGFLFSDYLKPSSEIPVGNDDVFLTTSWWTTKSVLEMFDNRRIIYLLQEDERNFYPYGDDHLRCTEIMNSFGIKFVINTKLLYDHFVSEGLENISKNGLWFEPSWSKNLFFREKHDRKSKKKFFFYARPNNVRNLFYLGLEVLNSAIVKGILDPEEWEFYFVGKEIPDSYIGNSITPKVYQNISLSDYAALVRRMDLGLCLMYSSHPSYPPLDLAASGAVVVTNRFGKKQDLGAYSKNILCFDLDVDSLVQGIEEGVRLASNTKLRLKNYQSNNILRDWKFSFKDVLNQLEGWSSDVLN